MEQPPENLNRKRLGRALGVVVTVGAAVVLLLAVLDTNRYPRTDDASVRANFIEIAPEVSGRLIELPVKRQPIRKERRSTICHRSSSLRIRFAAGALRSAGAGGADRRCQT